MKLIPLTQGKFAQVDNEDYEKLSKYKWHFHTGYAATTSKTIRMHRLILNAKVGEEVDHINRDKLDNRRGNLRICTRSENNHNMGLRRDNTSGYKGVNYFKLRKCWVARLQLGQKRYYLGGFATKTEAVLALEKARTVYTH